MTFHSTDESCRLHSFAEALTYAEKARKTTQEKAAALFKTWESYGGYVIDGRVSYSPPKDKTRIKRMCLGCRRREVRGIARYCDNPKCIRDRRSRNRRRGALKSSTYRGS